METEVVAVKRRPGRAQRSYLDAAPGEAGNGSIRSLVNLAGGGNRLQASSKAGKGGEHDFWFRFSKNEKRRLGSLGYTSVNGLAPDVWAAIAIETGAVPIADIGEDPATVCEWWLRLALTAATASKADGPAWENTDEPDPELPAWLTEWADSLLMEEKRAYALAYGAAVYDGRAEPVRPDNAWAGKVERKIANRYAASIARAA